MATTLFSVDFAVDTDRLAVFKKWFLEEHPIPTNDTGDDVYTFKEWFEHCIKEICQRRS